MRQSPQTSWKRVTQGVILMLLGALAIAGPALAQGIPDLDGLRGATPEADWSMKLWRSLFGDFADDPFSQLGGPTSLLGSVFIIFNGCIFVVGFTWALYGIMSGIVGTAHEGEVLGKRMSTVWFPIRMVTGIAGMVPIFGGFTLNQAIMMFLTTIGIGIGNTMWVGAVNNTAQMQGLLNNQAFQPTAATEAKQVAFSMFMSNVCAAAERDNNARTNATPEEVVRVQSVARPEDGVISYQYGSAKDYRRCGYVSATMTPRAGMNPLAFRVEAVDYEGIRNASYAAYRGSLGVLQAYLEQLAISWYNARSVALDAGNPVPDVPAAEIEAAAIEFTRQAAAATQMAAQALQQGALTEAARQNMLSVGWFGAGAWFSTFAEVNAGLADAVKAPKLVASFAENEVSSTAWNAIAAAAKSYQTTQTARGKASESGDGSRAILDSAIQDHCTLAGVNMGAGLGTATGNCSLGQGIVSAAIRATAIGAGGGGAGGGGNAGFDRQGLVNPIIMMKNMGDYVMSFSSTVLLAGPVSSLIEKVTSWNPLGSAAKVATKAVEAVGGEALKETMAVIKVIAMVTLVLGAAMAIYIPMIPFITWIGAILAYAASMIEGLAGATLHAMAHLDGDGDGMGQRTAHGYMFYINAVARPGLMIIGFFFASAIMIGIGTLQAHMFLPAMANVQGNSMTGLFSIAMFLVIFFVMNLTLITASFNLIYVITDQVIGFVGGQVDSKLGRDTEDKVNNMFLMAARVGPSAMGQAGAAKAAANRGEADNLSIGRPKAVDKP